MAHCASLIHDDLPCMDNAKMRRKKKSNHLIFGADLSLLAGTCLFIESFTLLNHPLFNDKKSQILKLWISKIGFHGLMSGQAMDLKRGFNSQKQLLKMIQLKTASLIEASVCGPVLLWGKSKKENKALYTYARNLGIAYQCADDLKDRDFHSLSEKQIWSLLESSDQKSLIALKALGKKAKDLKSLIFFNQKRVSKLKKRQNRK